MVAIKDHEPDLGQIAAAGIDSPLFWVASGDRQADKRVRKGMKLFNAPNVGGTVQRVNSLRGACVVQGIMAAHLLLKETPAIRLTYSQQ